MIAFKRHMPPAGARPGEFALRQGTHKTRANVFVYSAENFQELPLDSVKALPSGDSQSHVTWIDIQGLADEGLLKELAERYHIHPLALADVVNIPQRPKSEEYHEHHLFIVRMARLAPEARDSDGRRSSLPPPPQATTRTSAHNDSTPEKEVPVEKTADRLTIEQVSLIVGDDFVITFQEKHGDVLDPVRQRLRLGVGKMRSLGADYLSYAIIDTIVDGYFPIIEALGQELEDLEDEVLEDPSARHPQEIHGIRSLLQSIRRSLWPTRDMLSTATREENRYIREETRIYFRDAHDHSVQLVEVLEGQKESALGLMNTYLSVMSNRTNEVMKVLTVITTIFIPLSFLAGIYGMNFEHMPELHNRWSYPALWVVMLLIACGLGLFFRRKGWFESDG